MKNWLIYLLVFIGFTIIGLLVFGRNAQNDDDLPKNAEDFNAFYDQFLEDSLFQVSRITFPLEGLPSYAGEKEFKSFYWTEENWEAHQKVNYDSTDFTQHFKDIGYLIVETAHHPEGWGLERRFKLDGDNKWYLIYYAGINRVSKK